MSTYTLLPAATTGHSGSRTNYHGDLEHVPTAPATARERTREVLGRWGLADECIYTAMLLVSELVTNAVQHALPPITLMLRTEAAGDMPGVHIEVADGGPASLEKLAPSDPDEHGRGLVLLAVLAHSHGTAPGGDGGRRRWAVCRTQTAA